MAKIQFGSKEYFEKTIRILVQREFETYFRT